ncbi:hypothetical protein CEXT_461001 [Caerostris extrusa]|uniref:Uncharacterized protein n=1 Tax=Caerostris extrusa TaxID=172846 RepID=A0AAV4MUL3_CAEEX|nr:hypothetical protein CEXT_461001 [Caerostris extrusa]
MEETVETYDEPDQSQRITRELPKVTTSVKNFMTSPTKSSTPIKEQVLGAVSKVDAAKLVAPPGTAKPTAANGQTTASTGSPIASTSAAMDYETSTPTSPSNDNLFDFSIGSAITYLLERGVPLMQETLQHILPPLQDKCISSAQLLQVRHLMQLREDYTVFPMI